VNREISFCISATMAAEQRDWWKKLATAPHSRKKDSIAWPFDGSSAGVDPRAAALRTACRQMRRGRRRWRRPRADPEWSWCRVAQQRIGESALLEFHGGGCAQIRADVLFGSVSVSAEPRFFAAVCGIDHGQKAAVARVGGGRRQADDEFCALVSRRWA